MLNSYLKLSLVVLLGVMTLGLSSIAQAEPTFFNWIPALKKLDCPMTCKGRKMYVIMSGTDHKQRKPISVCTTRDKKRGEWLVGYYNLWKENTCIVGAGDEVYLGKKYRCLCTNRMLQPLRQPVLGYLVINGNYRLPRGSWVTIFGKRILVS